MVEFTIESQCKTFNNAGLRILHFTFFLIHFLFIEHIDVYMYMHIAYIKHHFILLSGIYVNGCLMCCFSSQVYTLVL